MRPLQRSGARLLQFVSSLSHLCRSGSVTRQRRPSHAKGERPVAADCMRPDTQHDRFAPSTTITDLAPHAHASKDRIERTRSVARDAPRTTTNALSCFATLGPRLSPNATPADHPRGVACVVAARAIGRYALRGKAPAAMACDLRDWLRTGPGSQPCRPGHALAAVRPQ
ncbi:hypothetical protein [Burkholderia ambifaria]|jgi:hypothetical protein|uniref:hypothetical protein n=1 Tax=Burkholderia ambifaria TaxID=152480 RepID=UPI0012FDE725|nr:hypothetical protein [Burkholderia ambifaria]